MKDLNEQTYQCSFIYHLTKDWRKRVVSSITGHVTKIRIKHNVSSLKKFSSKFTDFPWMQHTFKGGLKEYCELKDIF